jgi:hypothetical protein
MAGRPEEPHNVAALVLSGIILVALAVAIARPGSTMVTARAELSITRISPVVDVPES